VLEAKGIKVRRVKEVLEKYLEMERR